MVLWSLLKNIICLTFTNYSNGLKMKNTKHRKHALLIQPTLQLKYKKTSIE